ncbi:hypothetical protein L3X38_041485 [Prunus dulcis]|uniref:Anamorsin N-terminal domain-containing protein n=1 Tax=Prunus dulcis TaxID=3755 RepID=A0AAD4UUR8_PRUDU|nr:hypothetical protein L3X38_041485 [Prunus dulcis]
MMRLLDDDQPKFTQTEASPNTRARELFVFSRLQQRTKSSPHETRLCKLSIAEHKRESRLKAQDIAAFPVEEESILFVLVFRGLKICFTFDVMVNDAVLPVSLVFDVLREIGSGATEKCEPQIITEVSSLSQLPLGPSSVDIVFTLCRSIEFLNKQLLGEISRVLKPGGTVLIYKTSDSSKGESDKAASVIERKLLLSGFLEAQALQIKSNLPSELSS